MSVTAISSANDYTQARNQFPPADGTAGSANPYPAAFTNQPPPVTGTFHASTEASASASPVVTATPAAAAVAAVSHPSADLFTRMAPKPNPNPSAAAGNGSHTPSDYAARVQQSGAGQGIEQNSPRAVRQGKAIGAEVQAVNSQAAGSVNVDLSSPAAVDAARAQIAAAIVQQQSRENSPNPQTQALKTQASPVLAVNTVIAATVTSASGANPYTTYAAPENYAAPLPRGNTVNIHG